ncbi:MAG: energy transducer TonB [Brevinema sp.]
MLLYPTPAPRKRSFIGYFCFIMLAHIAFLGILSLLWAQKQDFRLFGSENAQTSTFSQSAELKNYPIIIQPDDIIELLAVPKVNPIVKPQEEPSDTITDTGLMTDPSVLAHFRDEYISRIAGLLNKHKHYPEAEKRRGREGFVTVAFTVYPDGSVAQVSIKDACPYSALNQAAIDTVYRAAPYPSFDKNTGEMNLSVSIEFLLRGQ